MPKVEVSDRTNKRLLELVESFEDTANRIIERLLDHYDATASADKLKPTNPPKEGELLPESEYWLPILEVLEKENGKAKGSEVIDVLEGKIGHLLKTRDQDILRMGEVRWRNRARFARLRMKELGLISSESPRGIWEITEKGYGFLAAERHQPPPGRSVR
jgi:hypothetical protein